MTKTADTIASLDEQIAALSARKAELAAKDRLAGLEAQGLPRELALLVVSDPDAAVKLGRAIEWTSRDTPPPTIPEVAGFTVSKSADGLTVAVAGAWAATLTRDDARRMGAALIRAGHHAESGYV